MMHDIDDITPRERNFLADIKYRPGMYLGTVSLTRLEGFINGYTTAVNALEKAEDHNIFPKGLHDFTAEKYLGTAETSKGCYELIREREPDEAKAFYIFFDILDEYLRSLGYAPLFIKDCEPHNKIEAI